MHKQKTSESKTFKTANKANKTLQNPSILRLLFSNKQMKLSCCCKKIAQESNWKIKHLPENPAETSTKDIRKLLNKEASAALKANRPKLCIRLINCYFQHYSTNLHAVLIKAEANYSLGKYSQALDSLKKFSAHPKSNYHSKAINLYKKIIAEQAVDHCKETSPEDSINYYARELLAMNIKPTYSKILNEILEKLHPPINLSSRSKLRNYELKSIYYGQLLLIYEEIYT